MSCQGRGQHPAMPDPARLLEGDEQRRDEASRCWTVAASRPQPVRSERSHAAVSMAARAASCAGGQPGTAHDVGRRCASATRAPAPTAAASDRAPRGTTMWTCSTIPAAQAPLLQAPSTSTSAASDHRSGRPPSAAPRRVSGPRCRTTTSGPMLAQRRGRDVPRDRAMVDPRGRELRSTDAPTPDVGQSRGGLAVDSSTLRDRRTCASTLVGAERPTRGRGRHLWTTGRASACCGSTRGRGVRPERHQTRERGPDKPTGGVRRCRGSSRGPRRPRPPSGSAAGASPGCCGRGS